ncbi:MAG TPA: pantoate--beta-alanine ligase [Flavisolibacter sp.]|nr:pantoate--beta-alanine ligase [Flavisolibacter sp.]
MIIFKKAVDLSNYIRQEKTSGQKIGFVPTMGALHKGHLTLVETARSSSNTTICSIFVNPTQFNNPDDFKHYPVTIENDIEQLVSAKCDALFLPSVEEIYPPGHIKKRYDLGSLETVLEGRYRPGHFQGVCEVVDRLLDITQPDHLYLGQKDFQQCMVISKLLELLGKDDQVRLTIVPTIREADGLALSSRNLRLDQEQRRKAPALYKALDFIRSHQGQMRLQELKDKARSQLEEKGFVVDYVEVASARDLSAPQSKPLVALVAATIGRIRLIDNLLLN